MRVTIVDIDNSGTRSRLQLANKSDLSTPVHRQILKLRQIFDLVVNNVEQMSSKRKTFDANKIVIGLPSRRDFEACSGGMVSAPIAK